MADKTSSTLVIAAARKAVMAIIADFGRYPDWATGVRSADIIEAGPDGRARRVRFALDAGPIKDSYVLAYDWDDDAAVRWQLAEPGSVVTEMSGGYLLAADGAGTQVSYELAVSTKLPLPGIVKRRAEKMIIDAALKGLRTRAEAASGDGTGG
jgi:hypothetical protein